jgi:hypothetical protein
MVFPFLLRLSIPQPLVHRNGCLFALLYRVNGQILSGTDAVSSGPDP